MCAGPKPEANSARMSLRPPLLIRNAVERSHEGRSCLGWKHVRGGRRLNSETGVSAFCERTFLFFARKTLRFFRDEKQDSFFRAHLPRPPMKKDSRCRSPVPLHAIRTDRQRTWAAGRAHCYNASRDLISSTNILLLALIQFQPGHRRQQVSASHTSAFANVGEFVVTAAGLTSRAVTRRETSLEKCFG